MSDQQQTPPPEITLSALKVIRQISIPIWVRLFSLMVAVLTFVGCLWLIAIGTVLCKGNCDLKISEIGIALFSSTFVPVLILTYIAFAKTGVEALKKRTDDLLLDTIPSIFNRPLVSWEGDDGDRGVQFLLRSRRKKINLPFYSRLWRSVTNKGHEGSSTEGYDINYKWGVHEVNDVHMFIDLNLLKVNVGMLVPVGSVLDVDKEKPLRILFEEIFGSVFEGAKHEGYK